MTDASGSPLPAMTQAQLVAWLLEWSDVRINHQRQMVLAADSEVEASYYRDEEVYFSRLAAFLRQPQPPREPSEASLRGIWECKIGEVEHSGLPNGCDLPMRQAVRAAYIEVTGAEPQFIFSGWAGSLTESQQAYVTESAGRERNGD